MMAPDQVATERLVALSLARLSDDELERIHLQLFFEDQVSPVDLDGTIAYRALAMLVSRLALERRHAQNDAAEVQVTRELVRLRQRVARRYESIPRLSERDLPWLVETYRSVTGRGIHPRELRQWFTSTTPLDRQAVMCAVQQVAEGERCLLERPRDVGMCWLMGTTRTIGPEDWRRRARELDRVGSVEPRSIGRQATSEGSEHIDDLIRTSSARQRLFGPPRCLVSVITSLYKGGGFIEAFMENLCSQTIFRHWCELIIVDAASPEGEGEVIQRWMADFPNIRYIRTPARIGVYEAWNRGVREARGELLTNANVDDLRRRDSLEIQASTLLALPDVDVTYQDVHYSLEPCHAFDRVAAFGFRSHVPQVTPAAMLSFNPPHNAPMWRRRLHDTLGLFDTRYVSAADYEFWLRCLAAGKVFHRVADPHVVYYQNPMGLSTRSGTAGHSETREITARYASRLLGIDSSFEGAHLTTGSSTSSTYRP